MNIRGKIYRIVMRIAHKYNWHYAPPVYPDGDTHLWCKWCGFRQTIRRAGDKRKILIGCKEPGFITRDLKQKRGRKNV